MTEDVIFDGSSQENQGSIQEPDPKPEEAKQEKPESSVEARLRLSPLSLTVFRRDTDNGVMRNLQLQRVYTRDDGDSFEYTSSLRPRDLRKAARLLVLAADKLDGIEVSSPE